MKNNRITSRDRVRADLAAAAVNLTYTQVERLVPRVPGAIHSGRLWFVDPAALLAAARAEGIRRNFHPTVKA